MVILDTILLIFLVSVSISAHQIDPTNNLLITHQSNLGFSNITGKGVTQQQINSFITFANAASFIYQQDMQKNTKYIKFRMDELYGKQSDNFYIFIQTENVVANYQIWVLVQSVYAGLNGINKQYPSWSYYFTRNYGSKMISKYDFFSKNQVGAGITPSLKSSITNIILSYETKDQCDCSLQSLKNIGSDLQFVTHNSWTIICDAKGITHSLILTFGKLYLSIRPKNCYYSMFSSV